MGVIGKRGSAPGRMGSTRCGPGLDAWHGALPLGLAQLCAGFDWCRAVLGLRDGQGIWGLYRGYTGVMSGFVI